MARTKIIETEVEAPKKRRGRPPKNAQAKVESPAQPAKRRGRPPKSESKVVEVATPKRRGRPPKNAAAAESKPTSKNGAKLVVGVTLNAPYLAGWLHSAGITSKISEAKSDIQRQVKKAAEDIGGIKLSFGKDGDGTLGNQPFAMTVEGDAPKKVVSAIKEQMTKSVLDAFPRLV